MRSLLTALSLACTAALLGCGGGRSADCSANKDCPSTQECVAGHCVSPGCGFGSQSCGVDTDCGLSQRCASGCCVTGQAAACKADLDCSARPSTPFCNTASGACVQCLQVHDCGQARLCQRGVCVSQPSCSQNADCKDPSLPVCDGTLRVCVQCLSGGDCTNPATPVCNTQHQCTAPPRCQAKTDCAAPTPVCDTKSGNCVVCLADTDCKPGLICSPQRACVPKTSNSCTGDTDCNGALPHCKVGTGGAAGMCVACVDSTQCPAGNLCAADNTCQAKGCGANTDCTNPQASICDLNDTPHVCVACLATPDCPTGSVCQTDHTCQFKGPCQIDADCAASDLTHPHCKVQAAGNVCVACLVDKDCGDPLTQQCTAKNVCQARCTKDADCSGTTPKCLANGTTPNTCVACLAAGDCMPGQKCTAANACAPTCTVATQGTDCAAPTPVCRESGATTACVACVKNADCNDASKICSSSNTCIAKPPACDVLPACTANNNCCPTGTVCNTGTTPRACVQCVVNGDCQNGLICDTPTHTCKPPPVGAEGQPCASDGSCNSGLICIGEAAGNVCRTVCDPYAAGNPCTAVAAGKVCEWIDFDATKKLFGFCAPANAHGAIGAACDPTKVDSCEWSLICAPTSAATGVCAALCDPAKTSTCASGACNALVGALDASAAPELMGYCGPASKWGKTCATDKGSSGLGDCGSTLGNRTSASLYCAPSVLPAENPAQNILEVCQFTPTAASAEGGAGTDCTQDGNDDCRSGLCLVDGPSTCFAACTTTADCTRNQDDPATCPSGGCSAANPSFCFDMTFSANAALGRASSCATGCRNLNDCANVGSAGFARTCVAQPTHAGSSWQTYCAPATAGVGRAGNKCASSGECASGVCLTADKLQSFELGIGLTGFAPTDGFCLGSCNPPNVDICGTAAAGAACTLSDTTAGVCGSGICKKACVAAGDCAIGDRCSGGFCEMNECGSLAGMRCDDVAGLPLSPTATGHKGVMGYPRYGACFGGGCVHDADCAGFSKDPATPRVCAPYKRAYTFSSDQNASCTLDSQCPTTSGGAATGYTGVCNTAANNPNPGGVYGASAGMFGPTGKCRSFSFALQCAPSLGAGKKSGGAVCAASAECKTGECMVAAEGVPVEASTTATSGVCYQACLSTADCAAGTCQSTTYLGIAAKTCRP